MLPPAAFFRRYEVRQSPSEPSGHAVAADCQVIEDAAFATPLFAMAAECRRYDRCRLAAAFFFIYAVRRQATR